MSGLLNADSLVLCGESKEDLRVVVGQFTAVCIRRGMKVNAGKSKVSGRRVAGTIRSLVNARDLQLASARVLHETLLVPVLMYGSKTMLWREKEKSSEGYTYGQPQRTAGY